MKPGARRLVKNSALALMWAAAFFLCALVLGAFPGIRSPEPEAETPAPARAVQGASGTVRVCVWNVKSYLDTYRFKDGARTKGPKPESEKAEIIRVLSGINPDVLGLSEIGGRPALLEFAEMLEEAGLDYPHKAVSDDSPEYPQCAILSKIPFEHVERAGTGAFEYFGQKARSPRGLLAARFNTLGTEWVFGALHLKSRFGARKRDPEFSKFRVLECREIAKFARRAAGDGAQAVIGGDFNDEPGDAAVLELESSGLKVMPCAGEPTTYFWKKGGSGHRFDFFMATPEILEASGPSRSTGIIRGASDHAPVYADLDFSKLRAKRQKAK